MAIRLLNHKRNKSTNDASDDEWEIAQGMLRDACGDLATQCDSVTTDYTLFLCTAHAIERALVHGGTVKTEPCQKMTRTP